MTEHRYWHGYASVDEAVRARKARIAAREGGVEPVKPHCPDCGGPLKQWWCRTCKAWHNASTAVAK